MLARVKEMRRFEAIIRLAMLPSSDDNSDQQSFSFFILVFQLDISFLYPRVTTMLHCFFCPSDESGDPTASC